MLIVIVILENYILNDVYCNDTYYTTTILVLYNYYFNYNINH